jgi:hypothetical protein
MANRVFFPQVAMDTWVVDGKVELGGDELLLHGEERRYRVEESVRILAELTTGECPRGLIGKVKARREMLELGAEIMDQSMIFEDRAYDVASGWTGTPIGTWDEHITSKTKKLAEAEPDARATSDEDLLAKVLLQGSR